MERLKLHHDLEKTTIRTHSQVSKVCTKQKTTQEAPRIGMNVEVQRGGRRTDVVLVDELLGFLRRFGHGFG